MLVAPWLLEWMGFLPVTAIHILFRQNEKNGCLLLHIGYYGKCRETDTRSVRQQRDTQMTADLSSIKAQIRAMSNKTVANGCTEAEAMTAIHLVGKLLQKYNLSMDEVQLRDEMCDTLKIHTGSKHKDGLYYAVSAVADFCDCKVWIVRGYSTGLSYSFFGQESDLLMARYLVDLIRKSIDTELASYKRTSEYLSCHLRGVSKRGASSSFGIGMGRRISQRLTDILRGNRAESTGNNALVVLKSQLVTEAYAALQLNLKKGYANTTVTDGHSYHKGAAAADRVNLNRPVNGPTGSVLSIGSR